MFYSNDEKILIILIVGIIIENYVIIILCDLIYIVLIEWVLCLLVFCFIGLKKVCYNIIKLLKYCMIFKGLSFCFKNLVFYSNI